MARPGDGAPYRPPTIPEYTPPAPKSVLGPRAAVSKPAATSSSSSGSTGSGGGGGGASSETKKLSDRYLRQAAALEGQIKALKNSISVGFKASLDQRLRNIQLSQTLGIDSLKEGYRARAGSLGDAAGNNERALASSDYSNLANRNRERTQMLAEAMMQGAGESDVLRSQQVALRNWDQNQNEVQRSFFDTLSSVNAGLRDLNVDTKTGFANVISGANGDRDSVWTTFYNQQSEALTQLGNLSGQQSEYYNLSNETTANAGVKTKEKTALAASDKAFMDASKENAKVWKDPGQPAWLKTWKGQADYESALRPRSYEQANQQGPRIKAPQGATLRKWDA